MAEGASALAETGPAVQPIRVASRITARNVSVSSAARPILEGVHLDVPAHGVLGIVGPSGAGKSTLLKCLNRLLDLSPGLRVQGEIRLDGQLLTALDPDGLRARVGMLFQQPTVFPRSIYQNVIFGVRHLGREPRRRWPEIAQRALRDAALWDEVAERLREPAARLSVGQQQRLCLARVLASDPDVLLMDEPTSALDPRSTQAIEDLIIELKDRCPIVLVTHDLGQARRVADRLACVCAVDGVGRLVEEAACRDLLEQPRSPAAIEYLQYSRR